MRWAWGGALGLLSGCAEDEHRTAVSLAGETVDVENPNAIHVAVGHILDRKVTLRFDKEVTATFSLRGLGLSADTEEWMARIRSRRADLSWLDTPFEGVQRLKGAAGDAPMAIDLPIQLDLKQLADATFALRESVDRKPRNATLDAETRRASAGEVGRVVDVPLLGLALIDSALRPSKAEEILVPKTTVPPRIDETFARSIDVSTKLAEFETYFSRSGDQMRRALNIENAAKKIDGWILPPFEIASFNEQVGERSEDNGFQKSWEIYKGEMVEGVGGGTCQVASTLYGGAFFSGVELVERLPHSRPSAYVPMGLDATVVYPIVDMKFRNPFPFPLVVSAKVVGNRLTVRLLGKEKPLRVSFSRELEEEIPFGRKVHEKAGLGPSEVIHSQYGIAGYKVKRVRKIEDARGVREEILHDAYPATADVYQVPAGFDVDRLPAIESPEEEPEPAAKATPGTPSTTPSLTSAAIPALSGPTATTIPNTPIVAAPADPTLVVREARGLHAPTAAQRKPEKVVSFSR